MAPVRRCSGLADGVDDVVPERLGIAFAQKFRRGDLDSAAVRICNAAPEDIILAAGIDADHRPYQVIMGHDRPIFAYRFVRPIEADRVAAVRQ